MTYFIITFRKMIKNKWLVLSLLAGLILATAVISCMPIYSDAILHRMIQKEFESIQKESHRYPATYTSFGLSQGQAQLSFPTTDRFFRETALPRFELPVLNHVRMRSTDPFDFKPIDTDRVEPLSGKASFMAIDKLEDHIRLLDGRLPTDESSGTTYEVLVAPSVLSELNVELGQEYRLDSNSIEKEVTVKPVGVIDKKKADDLYWKTPDINSYQTIFFLPFDQFEADFTNQGIVPARRSYWYTVFDYSDMRSDSFAAFLETHEAVQSRMEKHFNGTNNESPVLQTMEQFLEKKHRLQLLLMSLNIPIILLLAYYLYMMANLIIGRQKQEIAVLISRGAGRLQVFVLYLLEALILCSIAIVLGPWVGLLLTKMLGGANGFLEFVHRTGLAAELSSTAWQYALYVVAAALILLMIPVVKASKTSIVGLKQSQARKAVPSFFHRFYLDFLMLGAAIYGLWQFKAKMNNLTSLGLDFLAVQVDPFMFFVPALFVFGLGLLMLRLYPLLLHVIFRAGQKWWPPSIYASLVQVSRSSAQYQFLMVFLVMTIALGIFNASAARTMNQNYEDKIFYNNGADIILEPFWPSEYEYEPTGSSVPGQELEVASVKYTEPAFEPFTQLSGVDHAAQVLVKDQVEAITENGRENVRLLGIHTDQFGRTSWYRNDLFEYHYYEYLNLIADDPSAVLVSRAFAEAHQLELGDTFEMTWELVDRAAPFTVYSVIDYFPTQQNQEKLVVGNLSYIQQHIGKTPYQIWLELKPDADREAFYASIAARKLDVIDYKDSYEELISVKTDAYVLAINGVMSLGFLISTLICFFGFLLYWMLSLASRQLQFGIFQAIGITFVQVVGMLVFEQLLTTGSALMIGIVTGIVTSELFVPLFQLSFNMSNLVPPFQVMVLPEDIFRLFAIINIMLLAGVVILSVMLRKTNIHQAIKIGEE